MLYDTVVTYKPWWIDLILKQFNFFMLLNKLDLVDYFDMTLICSNLVTVHEKPLDAHSYRCVYMALLVGVKVVLRYKIKGLRSF